MRHNFKVIEKKWQKKWEDAKVFEAQDFSDKKKFYGLVQVCTLDISRHIPA